MQWLAMDIKIKCALQIQMVYQYVVHIQHKHPHKTMNQIQTKDIQPAHVCPHLMNAHQVSVVRVAPIVQQTLIVQQDHAVLQVTDVQQVAIAQRVRNVQPIPAARQAKSA